MFKAPSKKRRTFAAPVALIFMDGVEGRFAGLLRQSMKAEPAFIDSASVLVHAPN